MSDAQAPRPAVSRRAVAKGVAWSVPAVTIASAAPALAASGERPAGEAGAGCKLSGSSCSDVFVKGYVFEVTLTNSTGETIFLYNEPGFLITVTENNPSITLVFQDAVDAITGQIIRFPYRMPNGASLTILLNAGENGTSADQPIAGSIFFPWGHTATPPDPDNHAPIEVPFDYTSTPPVNGDGCELTEPPACGTF
jgi:hypothetical protein